MKKSDDSKMTSRRWKSLRTITRTISPRPKIEQMANDEEQEYRAEAEAF